jgi:hypothetical protein
MEGADLSDGGVTSAERVVAKGLIRELRGWSFRVESFGAWNDVASATGVAHRME